MKCPLCQTEMRISRTRYRTKNDDTADAETKLYAVQTLVCRNPQCENYGNVVTEVEHPLPISNN